MAEWWESAPVVGHSPAQNANWWEAAPVAAPPPSAPQATGPQRVQSGWDAGILGALDTATFGLLDETASGIDWALDKLPGRQGRTYDEILAANRTEQTGAQEQFPKSYLTGQVAGGVAMGAGAAGAGLSLGANAIRSGSGLGRVAIGSALDGAFMGGLQGFGSGEGIDDRLETAKDSSITGAIIGGIAPYAVAGASKAGRAIATPFRTSPERVAAASRLADEGVPLTAGQKTGSKGLRYLEAELGGGRAAGVVDDQADAFTSAVLRRAGVDANRASPEVMDQAFTRIGSQFDNLAQNNQFVPDNILSNNIQNAVSDYTSNVAESFRAPIVQSVVDDITSMRGPVSGAQYQNLTSRLARAARNTTDGDLKGALLGIRESLDDAMERSIATNNPHMSGAWREARNQYRNLLAIEQAATRAGETAAEGIITPANIRNAAVNQGKRAYARGQGDFADLARDGVMTMSPLPQSGTASRFNAQNVGMGLTSILGAGAGATMTGGSPAGAMAGVAAGAALPRAMGMLLMNPRMQSYLGNQWATQGASPQARGLANALLTYGGSAPAARLFGP